MSTSIDGPPPRCADTFRGTHALALYNREHRQRVNAVLQSDPEFRARYEELSNKNMTACLLLKKRFTR